METIMLIFLIFINLLASTCKGIDDDLELLLPLKSSSLNDHQLANWNSSHSHCKWDGVTCSQSSRVSEIQLAGKNLSGDIPESIFRLPFVQSVDLSSNQFSGRIPTTFLSCFNLNYLNLSGNNLTGPIPSGLHHLPSLRTLDLSNNMLSGRIPQDIGVFSGLRFLDFGGNALSGGIPGSVANLTELEVFTLASNQLTGEIPGELGQLKGLKWIYLGYNNFSGRIPVEIGELSSLNHLDLVYNNLTGEIPSSLGNLTSLENLFLYFNKLSGKIPNSVFNLNKLVSLDLSDNYFYGEIPELLINLQNLEILQLFSNNFSGKIPSALSSLPNLRVLQLWSNSLSGEIPRELGKRNNLTVLDLSTNNLTGRIPQNICGSRNLVKLILFSNSLDGEIPASLSFCKSLQRVRIQQNRLTGEIPLEFTKLPNVYYLDLSGNRISGQVSNRKWEMPRLQMLSLAENELFGPLPGSFGSTKLESLDLSGNNFSGRIPEKFGEFSELTNLKLNGNQLSGQIPHKLSYCKKLVTLDLSRNRFFGEIPASLADLPVLGQLDLSENELTGKIPVNLGSIQSLVQINISHNHLQGSLPPAGAFLTISSSAIAGNHLCGGKKITNLPPCSGAKNRTRTHWFVITFLLASLTIFAFVVIFVMRKGNKLCGRKESKRVESQDGTWQFWFANSGIAKMLTIKDILSCVEEEKNLVASGKTGFSYKGKSVLGNKIFLAKEMASISSAHYWSDWIELMRKISHPNVVKMLAMCRSGKRAFLVYEYVKGKDLSEAIRCLNWPQRIRVAVGVARALKYLHFGCSPGIVFETKGSKDWTEKSDIYGFGLLLIELLTGKSPRDAELSAIHESIVEWARYCYSDCHLEMWVDANIKKDEGLMSKYQNQVFEAMNLALRCTAGDPAARPCTLDLVQNLEAIARSSSCVWFLKI
ncbi:Probably inactive leucine-rich repeat receptor-like protein kinase [Striga hermonthica]|uniref:non-specific serine/threonine protein kinase n=1 Tax=Striga hermonthica TaxID=68872 RepID=A0A9N7NM77_STRHE|nr:Probably inactive leucine-rich repeat receptor-like protein kinase [Striga hermonthica]